MENRIGWKQYLGCSSGTTRCGWNHLDEIVIICRLEDVTVLLLGLVCVVPINTQDVRLDFNLDLSILSQKIVR